MILSEFILNMAKTLSIKGKELDILKFAKALIDNQFNLKEKCIIKLYEHIDNLEQIERNKILLELEVEEDSY